MIELDAASNRGIDDIREIRERVAVQPALGRRKIYILDEAHSLTTDASNALLKTLEEPPDHVVFVLCTTEPHKLLDTIKGRCQAFAFARPSVEEIRVVLRRIAAAEGIEADEDALGLIARSARRLVPRRRLAARPARHRAAAAWSRATDARALLGIVEEHVLRGIVDAAAPRNAPAALRAVDELATAGQDLGQLVSDLLGHLRLLLLTRELGEVPASAPLADEARAALARAGAARRRAARRRRCCRACSRVLDELRDGGDPRLPLELELVRAARPSTDRSIEAILRRLDALEVGGPAPIPPPPADRRTRGRARARRAGAAATRASAGAPSRRRRRPHLRRPPVAEETPPWDVEPAPAAPEPRPEPIAAAPSRRPLRWPAAPPPRPHRHAAAARRADIGPRLAAQDPDARRRAPAVAGAAPRAPPRRRCRRACCGCGSRPARSSRSRSPTPRPTARSWPRRSPPCSASAGGSCSRRSTAPPPTRRRPCRRRRRRPPSRCSSEEDSEAALIRGFVDAFDAHEIEEES